MTSTIQKIKSYYPEASFQGVRESQFTKEKAAEISKGYNRGLDLTAFAASSMLHEYGRKALLDVPQMTLCTIKATAVSACYGILGVWNTWMALGIKYKIFKISTPEFEAFLIDVHRILEDIRSGKFMYEFASVQEQEVYDLVQNPDYDDLNIDDLNIDDYNPVRIYEKVISEYLGIASNAFVVCGSLLKENLSQLIMEHKASAALASCAVLGAYYLHKNYSKYQILEAEKAISQNKNAAERANKEVLAALIAIAESLKTLDNKKLQDLIIFSERLLPPNVRFNIPTQNRASKISPQKERMIKLLTGRLYEKQVAGKVDGYRSFIVPRNEKAVFDRYGNIKNISHSNDVINELKCQNIIQASKSTKPYNRMKKDEQEGLLKEINRLIHEVEISTVEINPKALFHLNLGCLGILEVRPKSKP